MHKERHERQRPKHHGASEEGEGIPVEETGRLPKRGSLQRHELNRRGGEEGTAGQAEGGHELLGTGTTAVWFCP